MFTKMFTVFYQVSLFNRTQSRLLWEASSHTSINARKLFIVHNYPPLYIVSYSSIQLSELGQCRNNTAEQDSLSQEPEALPTAPLCYDKQFPCPWRGHVIVKSLLHIGKSHE